MSDIRLIESSSYKISESIDRNQNEARSGRTNFFSAMAVICVIVGAGIFLYKNIDRFKAIHNEKQDPNHLMRSRTETHNVRPVQSQKEMYYESAVSGGRRFDKRLKQKQNGQR